MPKDDATALSAPANSIAYIKDIDVALPLEHTDAGIYMVDVGWVKTPHG